jgi:hypothetical protein
MPSISSVKLGSLVAWPAFWTGMPLKIILFLLLLAAGLHPWELPGLAFLLVLSIPIDIWALNLAVRTVFLERLRLKAPDGIGVTLWWQAAFMSAIYLPILYVVQTEAMSVAKGIAAWIMEFLKEVPVAERITIELMLWATPATIVLIVLLLGWLFVFGRIVKRQAALAAPADAPLTVVVRQWDLMRVPADQPLLLTALTATGVVLVVLLWAFMPPTTPHPHESYKKDTAKVAPVIKPAEVLHKTEKVIAQAEATVQALEEKKATEDKDEKGKGKAPAKEPAKTAPAPEAKPVKAAGAAEKADSHSHDAEDHKH